MLAFCQCEKDGTFLEKGDSHRIFSFPSMAARLDEIAAGELPQYFLTKEWRLAISNATPC